MRQLVNCRKSVADKTLVQESWLSDIHSVSNLDSGRSTAAGSAWSMNLDQWWQSSPFWTGYCPVLHDQHGWGIWKSLFGFLGQINLQGNYVHFQLDRYEECSIIWWLDLSYLSCWKVRQVLLTNLIEREDREGKMDKCRRVPHFRAVQQILLSNSLQFWSYILRSLVQTIQ